MQSRLIGSVTEINAKYYKMGVIPSQDVGVMGNSLEMNFEG